MLSGTYRTRKKDVLGNYNIKISVRETEKSYLFTLVEDRSKEQQTRIRTMFGANNKVVIKKNRGIHRIIEYDNGDCFLIYPYRRGFPYLFKKIKVKGEC